VKQLLFWLTAAAAIAAAGAAGYNYYYLPRYGAGAVKYRSVAVRRGDVRQVVNSTGTVQPVLSVQVGSFVSGPILKVNVDFNDSVKKDQVLAQVDPRTYKATVDHEEADLAHSRADLARIQALYEQAVRNERRGVALDSARKGTISENDLDQCITDRKSLEAQIKLAEATIRESEANLATARTNLEFTDIRSPVDGVVVDRKVDPGQTVAAQFQTPVLFVVAPDLEKKVYVYASVDEADIGLIREAQARREPVSFTVDAYAKDEFQGKIFQVRLNPSTVQNVVTYTVVVESPNPGLKLLPGMTANLCFQIDRHRDVLTLANAAFRFYPKPEQVRAADRALLERGAGEGPASPGAAAADAAPAAGEGAAPRNRAQRWVWVADGELLSAVPVVTGLSDKRSAEIVSGGLREGQEVITGLQTATAKGSAETTEK
jgi:HlyD family secretion protein